MYDTAEALRYFDSNIAWILFFTAFAWIGGSVQCFEALRLTRRDGVIGFPLSYFCLVFAHDSSFALNYAHWLSIGHWFYSTMWYGMVFFALFEIFTIVWFLPKAHREYASNLPAPLYYAIYAVFQIVAFAAFQILETAMNDPLNFIGFMIAQLFSVAFLIPFLLRRGSTKGQSRLLGWAVLLGPASVGMLITPAMYPAMRTPIFYLMTAGTTMLGIVYLLLLERYRRRERSVLAAGALVV